MIRESPNNPGKEKNQMKYLNLSRGDGQEQGALYATALITIHQYRLNVPRVVGG